jgi:uncharacterized protein (DUF1330 family)
MMKSVLVDEKKYDEIIAGIPRDMPIIMVNMLKFKERAVYPDGSSDCTGREAYLRYSKVASKKVAEVGGRPFWMGRVHGSVIGPEGESWDSVMLVEYPSIQAFQQMVSMPEYLKCAVHRTASLEDSRLIATVKSDTPA